MGEYEDYDKREEDWVSETNSGYPIFIIQVIKFLREIYQAWGETYFSVKYKGLTQITRFRSYHGYRAQMIGPHQVVQFECECMSGH